MGAALSLPPAFLSITTALIILFGIFWRIKTRQAPRNNVLWLTLLLALVSLTPWFGEMKGYGDLIIRQLPLFLLPMAISAPPFAVSAEKFFSGMAIAAAGVGLVTLGDYLLHFQEMNAGLSRSKGILIATGVNHIYYSLIAAVACLYCISKSKITSAAGQLNLALTIILVIVLHTICARTGLLAFYFGAAIFALLCFRSKAFKLQVIVSAFLVLCAAGFAISAIPSLKARMQNAMEDVRLYQTKGDLNYRSISTRLVAAELAWDIFMHHPLTGVGVQNLQSEMAAEYAEKYPTLTADNQILPHQQLLFYAASAGVLAPLLLLLIFVVSICRASPFEAAILCLLFAAMISEAILQRQVGIALFAALIGLFSYRQFR